ncbi:MAG: cupin domain-containing protein [Steroidobacteraceae bacterium]|jgi:quercetin dioxygenase-like cupin family protein
MTTRLMALVLLPLLTVAYAATVPLPQLRLPPAVVDAMQAHEAGSGTSGVAGIHTTIVAGDPSLPGPYTIRLTIPPNTRIQAHTHRDNRTAVVVAGVWYFGYGPVAKTQAEKALPPGSFYTEPAGVAHFAETKGEPVTVYITGDGPTDTRYVQPGAEPAHR